MKRHVLLWLVMKLPEFEVGTSFKLLHYWGSDEVGMLNEFSLKPESLFTEVSLLVLPTFLVAPDVQIDRCYALLRKVACYGQYQVRWSWETWSDKLFHRIWSSLGPMCCMHVDDRKSRSNSDLLHLLFPVPNQEHECAADRKAREGHTMRTLLLSWHVHIFWVQNTCTGTSVKKKVLFTILLATWPSILNAMWFLLPYVCRTPPLYSTVPPQVYLEYKWIYIYIYIRIHEPRMHISCVW